MALPDFGLMTKEDKLKLDGIDTSTLLTKTEASSTYLTIAAARDTYATKAEMREYIRQVIESDTGYVFLDGTGSEVATIPAFVELEAPQLSIAPQSPSPHWIGVEAGHPELIDNTVTVTRFGSGVISAQSTDSNLSVSVDGTTITLGVFDNSQAVDNATVNVNLASDGTYAADSISFTVSIGTVSSVEPESPEPPM